ncbi:MAG: stage III sporulation protein AB [Lachnospiraceae bacterium]|nr:stage III sporulation protein AB [Lachnospiraceae bacterium]
MEAIIRVLAFLCVLLGSTGVGYSCIDSYGKKVMQTEQILQILIEFRQEIQYSRIPLPEVCRELSLRSMEPYGSLLKEFYHQILCRKGENISHLWREEIRKSGKKIVIPPEVRTVLMQIMDPIGYADSEMQVKKLDQHIDKIQKSLQQQRENQENKTRIYFSMGIMGGLLLGILFL